MVGSHDQERVFPLTGRLEPLHEPADLVVVVGHGLVVEALLGMGVRDAVDPDGVIVAQRECAPHTPQLAIPLVVRLAPVGTDEQTRERRHRMKRGVDVGRLKMHPIRLAWGSTPPVPVLAVQVHRRGGVDPGIGIAIRIHASIRRAARIRV